MNETWESEIAALLTELADVQTSLLSVLGEKRQLIAAGDHAALSAMAGREQELANRLQSCHEQRQQLLSRAGADGLPADSIRSLSDRLPEQSRDRVKTSLREAAGRSHLSTRAWRTGC
jgi:hypothetical protein